jgi:CHAT domain-containing protein
VLYEAGRFRDAIPLLERAVQFYQQQGDSLRQAIALSNLALTQQQVGELNAAQQSIQQSLSLLNSPGAVQTGTTAAVRAQILDVQGRIEFVQGQFERALTTWKQAGQIYQQLDDTTQQIRNQIDQSRALQGLGLYRQAALSLQDLDKMLQSQPNSLIKVAGLRSLGDALRMSGQLDQSDKKLQQSFELTKQLETSGTIPKAQLEEAIALTRLSQGNTARVQQRVKDALAFYQQAASGQGSSTTRLQAQLNQFNLLTTWLVQQESTQLANSKAKASIPQPTKSGQWSEAQFLLNTVQPQIAALPLSQTAIHVQLQYARTVAQGQGHWQIVDNQNPNSNLYVARLFVTAIRQGEALKDLHSLSYAWGYLGELYEKTKQWSEAEKCTLKALQPLGLVNVSTAPELTYLWQWQLGRIWKAQLDDNPTSNHEDDRKKAIAAYREAIQVSQGLRYDLVAINRDQQFSFRENIEPAYRQLIELLLQAAPKTSLLQQLGTATNTDQKLLVEARNTLEALQSTELQNFFREACINQPLVLDKIVEQTSQFQSQKVNSATTKTAIIYPIILPGQLSVVFKLPERESLLYYSTPVKREYFRETLKEFRDQLVKPMNINIPDQQPSANEKAKQIYNWLIRPAESVLQDQQINTLLFVLDGDLKNIPMAALYDGEQYLVEKYSIAFTPGLTIPDPHPLDRNQIRFLFAGVTNAVTVKGVANTDKVFAPLPNVELEATAIQKVLKDVKVRQSLILRNFQQADLQTKITEIPFQIVHLATHGEFSSDLEQTFILDANGKIPLTKLEQILRNRDRTRPEPIELLVLSACETAKGDDRAALGLAGVAVRSGARSTLATLWNVKDETSPPIMVEFYRQLLTHPSLSKAEALRQAQLKRINHPNDNHPYFWASYLLLGNWL